MTAVEGIESLSDRSGVSLPSSGMVRLNTELDGLAEQQREPSQNQDSSAMSEREVIADNEL